MKTDIQGIEHPSGEIFTFEECRRRNHFIEMSIDEMRAFAEEMIVQEKLTGTVFIATTIGHDRDSCGIAFEYPTSKDAEERLNRKYSARLYKAWAQNLPEDQREAHLQELRRRGFEV